MPSAIPDDAAARLPKARMIDPRGHRFGAGVSAVLLIVAFLTGTPLARRRRPAVDRGQRGVRPSLLDLRRDLAADRGRLALPKVEPEHEYPPRFAQVLGSMALILALVAFALGATTLGWGLALAVAGLQSLLATTGYCLGCRLYFLRWWVPDLVTRIWTRGRARARHDHARAGADQLPLSAGRRLPLIRQDVGPGVRPGRDAPRPRPRTASSPSDQIR